MRRYQRSVALKVLCAAAVVCVLAGQGNAQRKGKKTVRPERGNVALRTVYLTEPIGRAHRISITGELGGRGQVTLDGNTCTITQFGDAGICTQIHFPPIDIKLVPIRLADGTSQGRRLFRLEGRLQPAGARYFLVVPPARSASHRLIADLGNDRRRVVTLEPLPATKPQLCKTAHYRARQANGRVTIYAQGEHPTAGWKVAFEKLPIRIYPPQFRLVCVPPHGPAAQVITPFETKAGFDAEKSVKQVIVHDGQGQHKVRVDGKD